jgi:integrase
VGELLNDVLQDYKINGKGHVWVEQKVRLHLLPEFGTIRVAGLTTAMVQKYVAHRQEAGAANATVNRELAVLKRAFNLGRKHTPPKVVRAPHIPMLVENNVRKGFFEHAEYLRLLKVLRADVQPILTFAYFTGCRRGEILSLCWDQVDLREKVIRLDPGTTKNDEPRVIPLSADLFTALSEQKERVRAGTPFAELVFSRDGEPIRDLRRAWDDACFEAKLWTGDRKKGRPTRLFHDLRRTGVRNLIRAGVPERIAMAISGHKTRSIFDRYNIVSESDLKTAAERLDAYLATKTSQEPSTAEPKSSHTIRTHKARRRNGRPYLIDNMVPGAGLEPALSFRKNGF